MMLGLPAYGRHAQNPEMAKSFSELMDESSNEALSLQEWNGYRFDSPENVKKKVEFAKQQGMAGVFFWELGQDKQHAELGAGGILLEAAAEACCETIHCTRGKERVIVTNDTGRYHNTQDCLTCCTL